MSTVLTYSPAWRQLAEAWCDARDAATEVPAADPRGRAGMTPGPDTSPPAVAGPGVPQTCRGREEVGAPAAVGAGAPTSGPTA
ncbi:hypothetical protein [Phytohabitans houttuyneae]|uniref:Uncharacterized protein n=1 Tax=Phytohabitans houttuyneae TaxID=1076126 RepID=A0A6V8K731_9ACTN|nr:hypothetical protein [Phytohabitans houttuyneae]GFJ79564.1 hypothetical protein Phou_037440 [Phytohabitans houttuyneae]